MTKPLKNKIKNVIYFALNLISFFSSFKRASILMYHSVDNNNIFSTVKPEDFKRQMDYLRKNNYNIIPLLKLVELLKKNKKIPPKTVVLTFDDGYEDNYLFAFPLLKKYNFPAAVFLTTDFIGKIIEKRSNTLKMLDWQQITEIHNSGLIDFEPHTITHPKLTDISLEEARKEISHSKKIIEEKLNKSCPLFCYPKGRYNEEVMGILKEQGFEGAVTIIPGSVALGESPFLLKRNSVDSTTTMTQFRAKLKRSADMFYALKNER